MQKMGLLAVTDSSLHIALAEPAVVDPSLGQLAAGTCEIVTLDRDSSQPRRTIARQTARCACRKGQIAGTTRARPACVDARIIKTKQWCDMLPCLEGEGCDLLINRSGWTCTQPGGRIKTTTVS
uniref:chemokine-like protein TAFA-5 n=1 Tax=Myodes glareolus TaxID=447135 RepID=UPI002021C508|nr:chemokine-like protein TAFA-5 [Myodes glareolus]